MNTFIDFLQFLIYCKKANSSRSYWDLFLGEAYMKTVAIIGTFDTKGEELAYVKTRF